VQYFTHLPIVLVGAHMAGATLVWLGTLALVWATWVRSPAGASPENTASVLAGTPSS
jgi:cytochrome c oxidase assembly protein subunit 15